MPPAVAIIINIITIFIVFALYFMVYNRYRKRADPSTSASDVWRSMSSNTREGAWNGFLNETIAKAKYGPVGNFKSFEKVQKNARLYALT
jgi:hypothetical protein